MKKTAKRVLIVLIALLVIFVLFLVLWTFVIFPMTVGSEDGTSEGAAAEALADESEYIDYNEENGALYINNEIVVVMKESVKEEDAANFLEGYPDASTDDSMADIGIYRMVFADAMTYDEIEALLEEISGSYLVEDAYMSTLIEMEDSTEDGADDAASDDAAADEADAADSDADDAAGAVDTDAQETASVDPVYPNDTWNGASWNMDVPRDENWGMEAIDAPAAWAYLDEMVTVKIGLIDSMPSTSHGDLAVAGYTCQFIDTRSNNISYNTYTLSAKDHGTHVSGIMNASWNNDKGVSGVMGGKGELYYSAVYYETDGEAFSKYATAYTYLLALKELIDNDVQVINISQNTSRLIGFAASHGNQNAIDYLTEQASLAETGLSRIISLRQAAGEPDFVICVAAGNSNSTYYYKDDDEAYGYREEMTIWERIKYAFGWRGEIGGALALYNNFLNLMDEEEVMNRLIVVGAVGIDSSSSSSEATRYSYAYFSNVGSRVDIVAPGVDVYSCYASGYGNMSGTSMATPHVSGVAGLVFACNPDLSGAEVKEILLATAEGRYYYDGDYSGMVNAYQAVLMALETKENSVAAVVSTSTSGSGSLDLCFVVDTTGSMEDDIEDAKENMAEILSALSEKTSDYRVALIDYRDYSSRTGDSSDYAYEVQLDFSSDDDEITDAINALDLGYGGDENETVYSGLMAAVALDWRSGATKVIIVLGDAAPLDPEPETEYTFEDVVLALYNADIGVDLDESDERVLGDASDSLISVYSIGTSASDDAAEMFEEISEATGGSYVGVDEASEVSGAIIDSIGQIEVTPTVTVSVDFGDSMADTWVDLYSDDEFLFSVLTDEDGVCEIASIAEDTYTWKSNTIYAEGALKVTSDNTNITVQAPRGYWFTSALESWQWNRSLWLLIGGGILILCIFVPVITSRAAKSHRGRTNPPQMPQTDNVQPGMPQATADWPQPQTQQEQTPQEQAPQLQNCPYCGAPLPLNAHFCGNCGKPV